ncbi:MAG TPA: membrane dipeptidase [Candidatus Limnocylindria bacterium]|nr:membrane dipeptidase [Candidatus Limnocylindria bacterium]
MSDCCGGDPLARRAFLAGLLGAVTAACAGPTAPPAARRARDVLAQGAGATAGAPIIDLHAHPGRFTRRTTGELPVAALTELHGSGVTAAFFCAVADGPVIRRERGGITNYRDPAAGELHRQTLGQLRRVRARAEEGRVRLILAPSDVAAARRDGVPGALLACEGGDALEGQVARVRELHALGVRSIQLVHYRINELGDIQTAPSRHGGLTTAGAEVVAEMNRLGMIVDGAHASPATLRGILAASRRPIIVSHTGPARVRPFARHLDDDLLRAVAAGGGVVGVWPLARRGETLDVFMQDIDYVRALVGIEHVGIGTDMTGLSTFTSVPTYREFAAVPAALLARGYADGDVRRVLGANFMRLFEAAQP